MVAEQGSFLKASKECYITPASVMNQINKLESLVGVRLIERTNQGTRLTAAGRAFYQDAKKLIRQSEQAIARARQIGKDEQQTIRVGTSILRPCKTLVDLWAGIDDGTLPVAIRIVPFDDDPASMEAMLDSLGREIDCFVGPCDSLTWRERYNILSLEPVNCCIAAPRKHRLAKKEMLQWSDLDGETLLLVKRGDSPVLNRLRDEIERNHPQITLLDTPHFYDTNVFNQCEQMGCIMETLDIWRDVHPSIVTIPMMWDYKIPYGIVYAKKPAAPMQTVVTMLRSRLITAGVS
ncbi:LysR family transcriptional regulator [Pseudoflavonifractor phocaeensis]|nr:LysR family transcriptional regulator [Pseudoflavonifractor phocaeensis]